MQCCTGKKRGTSEPPRLGGDDLAMAGGPDDPSVKDKGAEPSQDENNAGDTDRNRSSSACCAGFKNVFKRKGKRSQEAKSNMNSGDEDEDQAKPKTRIFSEQQVLEKQFMVHLAQQGGIDEDMLEYAREYLKGKRTEFSKGERDLVAVTLKKAVAKDRKTVQLLCHLYEQPKLKKYEANMRVYLDKMREEARQNLTEIVQLLQAECLPKSTSFESKAFFSNLIGDFYRYQIEMIKIDEDAPLDQQTPLQKKFKRDRDNLMTKASDIFLEAFKLSVQYLNPCNSTRLSIMLNYSVFLLEFKKQHKKAIKLSEVTMELALNMIDDSAHAEEQFTYEETELIERIKQNIALWKDEYVIEFDPPLERENSASRNITFDGKKTPPIPI